MKSIKIDKDTQTYIIPSGDRLRVCIDNESLWKDMTVNAYINLIDNVDLQLRQNLWTVCSQELEDRLFQ